MEEHTMCDSVSEDIDTGDPPDDDAKIVALCRLVLGKSTPAEPLDAAGALLEYATRTATENSRLSRRLDNAMAELSKRTARTAAPEIPDADKLAGAIERDTDWCVDDLLRLHQQSPSALAKLLGARREV